MRALAAGVLVCVALEAAPFDHSGWDRILKQYVNGIGEVDYAALKKDRAGLDTYIDRIAEASPESRKDDFPTRADELAYWLNAYNALVMRGVIDGYPTRSVRDLGALYGFFWRKHFMLGGKRVTLRGLENDIIRKRYGDARIHFAIVCASISCPLLSRDAFTAANVEGQLDRLTRQSLAERRFLAVDPGSNTITLSALFDWYKEDYGGVIEFVKKHAGEAQRKAIDSLKSPKIRYYDYDWSINDIGTRAKAKAEHERQAEVAQQSSGSR
jgi:hypothetical protein